MTTLVLVTANARAQTAIHQVSPRRGSELGQGRAVDRAPNPLLLIVQPAHKS